jgi:6-pyruvoyltetrahydropterin/6-carboxytetrahydropterin synthase
MGHRLVGHESKCAHVHGHNYVGFFHAAAEDLDDVGRVIDFAVLKERVGGWIDENWDHGFVFNQTDTLVKQFVQGIDTVDDWQEAFAGPGRRQKWWEMDTNPTAENIADYLLRVVGPEVLQGTGVKLVKVVVWETENCYAEVTL